MGVRFVRFYVSAADFSWLENFFEKFQKFIRSTGHAVLLVKFLKFSPGPSKGMTGVAIDQVNIVQARIVQMRRLSK